MNILILGAGGMLGHAFVKRLQKTSYQILAPTKQVLNITKPLQIEQYFSRHNIDLILHCAAYTNVEEAESNEDECFRINAEGLAHLLEHNVPIIHFSTDYVFDQKQSALQQGIPEDMHQNAINVYGKSKQMAEKLLESGENKWWNIRTSWLYGPSGKNFVDTMRTKLQTEPEVSVVDNQIGRPTSIQDLVEFVVTHFIDNTQQIGHYHLQNSGKEVSWHEITQSIQDTLKTNCTIHPVSSETFPTKAKRPKWSVLENTKLPPMPEWSESLRKYLES